MEKRWTKEQSEIISHRGGNLLVSAGAGAGKTAVLVERILGRILEEEKPIRLDELLVVTFTRAAAAEMKERIGLALEEKLSNLSGKPEEEALAGKLMEEYALLPQAEISTIDSFCKSVIMENFQKTDLDPSFRIADETELALLKMELLEDFLEENFKKADPSFFRLVEYFERGKKDGKLSELILDLLTMSESFPDTEAWFLDRMKEMDTGLFHHEKLPDFSDFLLKRILAAKKMNERALSLVYEKGGPLQYAEALLSDKELIDRLLSVKRMEDFFPLFSELDFKVLGRAKPKGVDGKALFVDEDLQNKVKELRAGYKNLLTKKIKERYFFDSIETLSQEDEVIREILKSLLSLSLKYAKAYSALKKKKNIVDFSDLSHTALRLLLDKKGKPTDIAREYQKKFAEIMIDEYQDSNLIQDLLLTSISREKAGEPNLFMVGDVKQSIYGFRQAEPKIFLEKYHTYEEEGTYRKISLFKNFRSSKAVIDTVNAVFGRIMRKEIGGLHYDEKAALAVGRADAYEILEKNKTEILIYDDTLTDDEVEEIFSDFTMKEKEAYLIGSRIKTLRKEGWKYSDITILLRSITGWSEEFKVVFSSMGIPATSDTSTGYFRAWEVQVILALLSIIDNPRQDIPLATVLLSPIGDFTETELSELRLESESKKLLWDDFSSSETEKVRKFLSFLEKKRREAIYLPVHELVSLIYEETGFYDFVSGMKGGEVRTANLDMLIVKAKDFEQTSLFGLTSFVKYIEKLRKYEKDFGEAEVLETGDSVRIMSIHKSKGLEFPVVFVSGLMKSFNEMDAKKTVVIHKEVGLATDYFNIETREEGRSFLKSLISDKIKLDNLSEEIRILYVALTRAREKLILTGTMKEAIQTIEAIEEKRLGLKEEELFSDILDSDNFMELLLPSLLEEGLDFVLPPRIYGRKEIYEKEGEAISDNEDFRKEFYEGVESEFSSLEEREAYRSIEKEFAYTYPYEETLNMKPSMTVSELKRLHLSEEEGYEEMAFLHEKEKREGLFDGLKYYEPKFLEEESGKKTLSPTEKGSLVHKFLSKMSFQKDYTKEEIRLGLDALSEERMVEDFYVDSLYRFMQSPLAKRMKEAERRKELFREMPFTLGIDRKVGEEEETIVVQGIIDAWFLENGEPVLLDYKTDRVKKETGEEVLRDRYQSQLNYYAEAIKRATGKEVKEKMIYALSLSKTIPIC